MARAIDVVSKNPINKLLDYQEGMKVSRAPDVLRTEHVGDCLALTLHDNDGIGGLAHIQFSTRLRKILCYSYLYPYFIVFNKPIVTAETVVDEMLDEMQKYGSGLRNVVAKMAGEQKRHLSSTPIPGYYGGDKKSKIVKEKLLQHGIQLVAEDLCDPSVGISQREVMYFDLATRELRITYLIRYKSGKEERFYRTI
jgi:chemotaxis receptor (MCP) glutamine deamidase CheD